MTVYQDPLESAENPEVSLPEYFGQAILDVYYCVLVKGTGKVPFNPDLHKPEERRTAVKLGILPLAEQNITRDVFREFIAEFGAWPKTTLPSIKAAGLTLRTLNNAWIRLALVSEGRTYTDKNGETKDSLTFKVVASYPDEATCRNAYLNQTVSSGTEPAQPAPVNGNGNGAAGNAREKETALAFVKVLITQTHGDETALGPRIASMPILAKYFTVASPEVRTLLDTYQFEQMKAA